jgi:hypothetical protein
MRSPVPGGGTVAKSFAGATTCGDPRKGQVETLRRGLAARAPVPPRAGALVGGAVLAVSTIAFFRVPLLPAIGDDLGLAPTTLSLVTTMFACRAA